ncbi:hypothetical protein [Sorangium cellulosum]|uniref:hypothetical protein n=1 Tax=Sorangium cellulosum TaxID=56 RepID=UPI0007792D6A|nr:hypothetical protein [Sorangium cellulosum]
MLVDSPIDNPTAWDSITIDGIDTPGTCELSGGVRRTKIDQQVSPMQSGSFSVTRGLELVQVDYKVRVWTTEQFNELQALAARLATAQESRPPRQLRLVDIAVAHLKMKGAEVAWLGAIENPKPGRWTLGFGLLEWKKRKPIGGVARAKDWIDQEMVATRQERAQLESQLQALETARGRGL